MIGEKIRQARLAQQRSLAEVAAKAKVSVATLSRIETDKQALDLALFLSIAKVLKIAANDLLGEEGVGDGEVDPLARRIAGLQARERVQLWRELAAERRSSRAGSRQQQMNNVGQQVEELLAQVDFLREELESVRKRIKKR